jgi:NADH-quinone oxidoreductase subunit F
MGKLTSIGNLQQLQKTILQGIDPKRPKVRICMTGCRAFGAVEVRDAFKDSIQ